MKKYELTSETKIHFGKTLYRIRALVSFGSVASGDFGGFVEKEDNLSHEGNAWVLGNARVSGDARVSGNAWVFGNAMVYGNARVFGNADVFGNSEVFGDAWVFGNSEVFGDAWVFGNARVFGNSEVFGNARVFGDARVSGDAWVFGNARVSGDTEVTPINITGLQYIVTITDTHIKIGCEYHSIDDWDQFDDRRILEMDGQRALDWWKVYRHAVMALAREHEVKVKAVKAAFSVSQED